MRIDSASGAAAILVALVLLAAALPSGRRAPDAVFPAPRSGAARLLWGLPLDLNHEVERTLEVLPGIGPTRARAIAAARPFCRASDLDRVPGIGPATLRRLEGQVVASGSKSACGD